MTAAGRYLKRLCDRTFLSLWSYLGISRVHECAMLGPPKPCRLDRPIAVSLEDLVPREHFYRHLEARLKLSFVREWTGELYAAPAVVVLQALGIGDW